MKKLCLLCIMLCLMVTMSGCSEQNVQEPKETTIQIVDQAGREVRLDQPAEKVASGYYIATTTLIGLSAADQLVGVEMKADTREIYHQAAPEILSLPALGNKKMFHVEECAKADPDVVFLPVSLQSYVEQLEMLGIQVVLLNPETQQGFDEAVKLIAKVCGKEKQAEAYFNYRKTLLDTYIKEEKTSGQRVYMAGLELLEVAGDRMFQGELIKAAKGENIITAGQNTWMKINIETLLDKDPDYLFLEYGGLSSEDVYADPTLSELSAVKNKQVFVFPSSLETWDTPNLSYCLGTLWAYSVMHPDQVSKQDVKKEAKAFYQQFYGIEIDPETLGI